MNNTYYPKTNDGRADWWQNIIDNAGVLPQVGFTATEITSITNDAKWGVYLYRTVRGVFEDLHSAVIAYADAITDQQGAALPQPPAIPAWPAAPTAIVPGLEARREMWVQEAKKNPGYNASIGALLKLESTGTTFNPANYQATLLNLTSPSAHTVSGKFRKAGGEIDGINLYGRKEGTTEWKNLGRFNATPFTALVPVTTPTGPESWEFRDQAVKRDQEIGQPSDIIPLIVRG